MEIDPIVTNDFTTFTPGRIAPHVKLEQLLTQIGGGSAEGSAYKQQVLKLAGWKYNPIIGYAKHPDTAALAFNRVRDIILATQARDEIVTRLSQGQPAA
jgi:hypothetical protein